MCYKNNINYVIIWSIKKVEYMGYNVQLEEFQGPLDVLLDLIKKNTLNIWDVNLSVVTDQYLQYLRNMEAINLNVSSDYLVIAADLINIKSKKLLPHQEEKSEEEEEFLHRIIEYKQYKEAGEKLRLLHIERLKSFSKSPSDISNYKRKEDKCHTLEIDELVDAFAQFLLRKNEEQPLTASIVKKEYSINKRKKEIMTLLKNKKKIQFQELFDEFNRTYIIITFLTILDMSQKSLIDILQNKDKQIVLLLKEGAK